jgi:predicted negative regulator of RcsB-dependent stress response
MSNEEKETMADNEFRRWWDKAGQTLAALVLAGLIGACGHVWGKIDAAEVRLNALEKVDAVKDEKFTTINKKLDDLTLDVKALLNKTR